MYRRTPCLEMRQHAEADAQRFNRRSVADAAQECEVTQTFLTGHEAFATKAPKKCNSASRAAACAPRLALEAARARQLMMTPEVQPVETPLVGLLWNSIRAPIHLCFNNSVR